MAFEKIVPQWNAAGTEPPEDLKNSGFEAGYKPPAAFFNWFWHGVSEALSELQSEAAVGKQTLAVGTDLNTVTVSGFYRLASGHAHAPNRSDYGQLLVMHGGGDTITQIAASYIDGTLWTRSGNPTDVAGTGTWLDWKQLSTTDDASAQLVYSRYSLDTTVGGTELDDLLETIIADMDKSSVRVVAIHDTQGYSALGGGTSFITVHRYSESNVVLSAFKYNGAAFRTRVKASGTWADWAAVYSTANKPTPAAIGAAPSSHNHSTDNITSGTLPVARGGTGQSSVDSTPTSGSSKMVTSGGVYTALAGKAGKEAILYTPQTLTAAQQAQARANITAASTALYTATIPATGWSEAAPYSVTIAVDGILTTDTPLVDIVQTGDEATDAPLREAWAAITRITTADGSITVYAAEEIPAVEIPIQMKVVR